MNDAPTATEFIPAEENGIRDDEGPGVRHLQATGDKGLELVNEEPHDEPIRNRVFICDECGHEEWVETDMAQHLHYKHVLGGE